MRFQLFDRGDFEESVGDRGISGLLPLSAHSTFNEAVQIASVDFGGVDAVIYDTLGKTITVVDSSGRVLKVLSTSDLRSQGFI